MTDPTDIPAADVSALLCTAGLPTDYQLVPLKGGGNNRVYRIDCGGDTGAAALKAYFRHPQDPRDRLSAEFSFCRFAWDAGIRYVPKPLASDPVHQLGLYEFIDGQKLAPSDVDEAAILSALDFYDRLNKQRSAATSLGAGSEACFSITEHLNCVDRRLGRLESIDTASTSGAEALKLLRRKLRPLFSAIEDGILAWCQQIKSPPTQPLAEQDRRLSPSDFGFHNALRAGGPLRFIDFEYAGWDDPAKMVCDFFCQPAVPVSMEFFDAFAAVVARDLTDPKRFTDRVTLLLPLYRLKWCCIMLNEFLPVGLSRRSFAREGGDQEHRKAMQLAKVREALTYLNA